MLDFFYSIDLAIFYFFNHTLSFGLLDKFFATITNVNNWYITYIFLLGIVFIKGGVKGRIGVGMILVLIIFTDQLGHKVIKEIFQRLRPCNVLFDVITPLGCTGSYSFPSNHALNNFAAATFFYRLFPSYKWVLFITATLVSISRIYLGLHYPSDVLAGAVIGSAIGYLFSIAALKIENQILKKIQQ